jgi:hypothetical protein
MRRSRFEQVQADGVEEQWWLRRIQLIVSGVALWLLGPILLIWAPVDTYLNVDSGAWWMVATMPPLFVAAVVVHTLLVRRYRREMRTRPPRRRERREHREHRRRRWRLNLVTIGLLVWLIAPVLTFVGLDMYRDGSAFREGSTTATATVVDHGTRSLRRGGRRNRDYDRNMLVEFLAGGERRSVRVWLPKRVEVGATVQIEYAVSDPRVNNRVGRRPLGHQPWAWLLPAVPAAVFVAGGAGHVALVVARRKEPRPGGT